MTRSGYGVPTEGDAVSEVGYGYVTVSKVTLVMGTIRIRLGGTERVQNDLEPGTKDLDGRFKTVRDGSRRTRRF